MLRGQVRRECLGGGGVGRRREVGRVGADGGMRAQRLASRCNDATAEILVNESGVWIHHIVRTPAFLPTAFILNERRGFMVNSR